MRLVPAFCFIFAYREYKMIVRRDRIRIVTFLEEDLLGFKKFSSYCSNHARFM